MFALNNNRRYKISDRIRIIHFLHRRKLQTTLTNNSPRFSETATLETRVDCQLIWLGWGEAVISHSRQASHLTVFSEGCRSHSFFWLLKIWWNNNLFLSKTVFSFFSSDYLNMYVRAYLCDLRTCRMWWGTEIIILVTYIIHVWCASIFPRNSYSSWRHIPSLERSNCMLFVDGVWEEYAMR